MEHPYNGADLDSVLRTLSSLASQSNPPEGRHPGASDSNGSNQIQPNVSHTPRQTSPNPPKPASTSTVDPSTITTWPTALRYVMRTVGQDEEAQLRIRGLIRSQHNHERQWWKGREALLQKQQARGDKKKELDSVLRSIGAPVDSNDIPTHQEDQAEIARYDAKVYRASAQMAEALNAELRGFKIPFFVLQPGMIGKPLSGAGDKLSKPGETHNDASKLTRPELADLQRRMLGLLEDLCKE